MSQQKRSIVCLFIRNCDGDTNELLDENTSKYHRHYFRIIDEMNSYKEIIHFAYMNSSMYSTPTMFLSCLSKQSNYKLGFPFGLLYFQ